MTVSIHSPRRKTVSYQRKCRWCSSLRWYKQCGSFEDVSWQRAIDVKASAYFCRRNESGIESDVTDAQSGAHTDTEHWWQASKGSLCQKSPYTTKTLWWHFWRFQVNGGTFIHNILCGWYWLLSQPTESFVNQQEGNPLWSVWFCLSLARCGGIATRDCPQTNYSLLSDSTCHNCLS